MSYADNPRLKCENCISCKKLWWWVYKEGGHIDHKEYGNVCTVFEKEGGYWKMDSTEGLCEMFVDKDAEDDSDKVHCYDCKHGKVGEHELYLMVKCELDEIWRNANASCDKGEYE